MRIPFTLLLVLLACSLVLGCKKQASKPPQPAQQVGENPVTAPVDYLGAVVKAQQSAVKTIDTVNLTQAIRVFEGEENRYPTNLQELVAKGTLPALPKPPARMKFDYNPATGQVKVVPE